MATKTPYYDVSYQSCGKIQVGRMYQYIPNNDWKLLHFRKAKKSTGVGDFSLIQEPFFVLRIENAFKSYDMNARDVLALTPKGVGYFIFYPADSNMFMFEPLDCHE